MLPPDIACILQPFLGETTLSREQVAAVSAYLDLLLRWNARINLTAVRDPEQMLTRHFGESFFAACHLFPAGRETAADAPALADVGSGAGFPGLPIKILCPAISLTLIESSHKKSTFLREVVRALSLDNVNVLNLRAEDLLSTTYNVVTLRAVERFEAVLPTAAGLVAPGGRLGLLIGTSQIEVARAILASWVWRKPVPIPFSESRILMIGERTSAQE